MNIAVVYWSGTGNTQAMAEAVARGIVKGGAEAELLPVDQADPAKIAAEDAFALGCPSMGAEELEELERLLQEGEKNRKEEVFAGGKPVKNAGKYRNPQKENGKRKQRRFL